MYYTYKSSAMLFQLNVFYNVLLLTILQWLYIYTIYKLIKFLFKSNCQPLVWVSLIIYINFAAYLYVVATLRFNFLTNHEVFYFLYNSAYTKMGYWVEEL